MVVTMMTVILDYFVPISLFFFCSITFIGMTIFSGWCLRIFLSTNFFCLFLFWIRFVLFLFLSVFFCANDFFSSYPFVVAAIAVFTHWLFLSDVQIIILVSIWTAGIYFYFLFCYSRYIYCKECNCYRIVDRLFRYDKITFFPCCCSFFQFRSTTIRIEWFFFSPYRCTNLNFSLLSLLFIHIVFPMSIIIVSFRWFFIWSFFSFQWFCPPIHPFITYHYHWEVYNFKSLRHQ